MSATMALDWYDDEGEGETALFPGGLAQVWEDETCDGPVWAWLIAWDDYHDDDGTCDTEQQAKAAVRDAILRGRP